MHTISRAGRYYYNRRAPKHSVQAYGSFTRLALTKDPDEATAYAKRLGNVLVGSWVIRAVNEDQSSLTHLVHTQSTHIEFSSCVDWQQLSMLAPVSSTLGAPGILRSYRIYDNYSGVVNSPIHLSTQSVAVMFPAYEQLPLCDIPAYLPQPARVS